MRSIGVLLLFVCAAAAYDHSKAVEYASKWWNGANHECSKAYTSCTPYSYWGNEHCGYSSHGGDCANFVSQCLLAGGHPALKGSTHCRGYPCGKEEVGARNLGLCLSGTFGWKRTCGKHHAPPSGLKPGDVLIYHAGSCDGGTAHATLVTKVSGSSVSVTCHSNSHHNVDHNYLKDSHPYYEFLQHS